MSDMRADFEAAIEASGVESEDENALQETPQEVEMLDTTGDESSDDSPPTIKEETVSHQNEEGAEQEPTITEAKGEKEEKPVTNDHDSIKAPLDWSPKQRESWSKIPRPIQDKIVAREQEMAQTIAGTAEARKTADRFSQLASSYAPVLAAEGVNTPMEAVEGLFKTAANLRMGSPEQKAQQIAQMIKHYGVDIQALDNVLVGQPVQKAPNADFEQLINQKLAPINQVFEQLTALQQQKAQQSQQTANQSVVEFGQKAEFLNDVRNDMADLIDMAAKQGRNLTLQEAYDRACALNPEIAQVIEERKREEQILGGRSQIAAKRNAASTLNGKMSGSGGGTSNLSLRDTIASAWDEAGQ